MLKPTWYLTDGDFNAELPHAPRHDPATDWLAATTLGAAKDLLSHEAPFGLAYTAVALRIGLLCAERLHDTVGHDAQRHDMAELIRLVHGLNLLHAYLTQTIQQVAQQTHSRTFGDLADYRLDAVQAVTDSLSAAGANGELVAGHLKEAHLALRNLTR